MAVTFIHDIEEALIAELTTKLGVGSLVYPTPGYLQLQYVGRAGGRPVPLLPDQQTPALWVEYLGGTPRKSEIGANWPTMAIEAFNVFGVMRITSELLDCPNDDLVTFNRLAEAAIGILLRRVMKTLAEFDPSITDDMLGYKTNGQRLAGWAYNGVTRGSTVIDYSIILRYESQVMV